MFESIYSLHAQLVAAADALKRAAERTVEAVEISLIAFDAKNR